MVAPSPNSRFGTLARVLSSVKLALTPTVTAATPAVARLVTVVVGLVPVKLLVTVMAGMVDLASWFWKVMVKGPVPATTVLPVPTLERALRADWMLAARTEPVALKGIALEVAPLKVKVK